MVETYQAGSSQEGSEAERRSYRTGASGQPAYPPSDGKLRTDAGRNADNAFRRRRRADLLFEDSIVLLGILIGGAIGYTTATTVRRTTWGSNPPHRSSE